MDKTVVIGCQANDASFICEDCIVFKEYALNKKNNEKPANAQMLTS